MLVHDFQRDIYYCDCNGNTKENVSYNLEKETITCKDCGTVYNEKPHIGRCFKCHTEFKKYAWWVPSGCRKCFMSFVE